MTPPVAVGEALSDALTWAYDAPSSTFASGEQERLGAAHGYAFRAAELAYDLGQRHAREREARARLRPRVLSPEEVEADRAAARDMVLRRGQAAADRAGLLLALDTRD